MDSATPFQPWTATDSAKTVKNEGEVVDDAKLHRENVNRRKHTRTASQEREHLPGQGSTADGSSPARAPAPAMDADKAASMQQIVENTLSPDEKLRVSQLLSAVENLSGPEKLLLYLRLPTGVPPHDPLKQPVNPLGSRAELQQTVTWIQTHLEVDPDVSLPKQDVYDEYIAFCMSSSMKPLSTADFGKVMKQVYPTVRPRRLGTRGNSRYCYAGLRKKIKLEVPQLPDLGESSKTIKDIETVSRGSERIICDWAETKLGIKFDTIAELSRHLQSTSVSTPLGPPSASPPPVSIPQPHGSTDDARHLMKQLKRKIQSQSTPGRPKKNKAPEVTEEPSPAPSTSYIVKQEGGAGDLPEHGYYPPYVPLYEPRPPYPSYSVPPRAHDYHYPFEPPYPAPRDLSLPADPAHNLPINLSSDASLDLSTERTEWQRRRPPEPPPARLPLPGKKLILETYQSETRSGDPRPAPLPAEHFPRSEYLPKKMRAAEILGGKLAAARHSLASASAATTSAQCAVPPPEDPFRRQEVVFLDDPKNATSRSKSTAAALVREELEAASPTKSAEAPTPKPQRSKRKYARAKSADASRAVGGSDRTVTPDSCCGLDGINIKTGVICEEKHSEILNRERVISICNMDKHALDDYLHEGSSQGHEEELLQYFQRDELAPAHDDSQGKNEKLSQLRELLAKNLKTQSGGANSQTVPLNEEQFSIEQNHSQTTVDGAFKPIVGTGVGEIVNGQPLSVMNENCVNKNSVVMDNSANTLGFNNNTLQAVGVNGSSGPHLYNGNGQSVPQSPTTRAQQYDFVPISDGCHSPANFHAKSPTGFGVRANSPSKVRKPMLMCGSLQTSPTPHSTAASPFVSPRNTPVPRSRLCSRPIPKHNVRRRRTMLSLGMGDNCVKQFVMPTDQKMVSKPTMCGPGLKYCQPMSAPPSPNILCSQLKNQLHQGMPAVSNGNLNLSLNFLPGAQFRDTINGDHSHPLSADPLSSEVSQFFQESMIPFSSDTSFRSQSVPLKQGLCNMGLLSYNNTPVGSVPPTPVPNEFCDFGSLADTCDISKACLNPESLDKIYDAIDSSNDVLGDVPLEALMPSTGAHYDSVDLELSGLDADRGKYYTSRSVPSTPLPCTRVTTQPDLTCQTDNYGLLSKSVPSTPQLPDERSVFSYSNRDFLINGNSVRALSPPLHDMDVMLDPLAPHTDLLADLDKIDAQPYDL